MFEFFLFCLEVRNCKVFTSEEYLFVLGLQGAETIVYQNDK